MGVDTPSSRKVCCVKLFDSFTGSRLAYLETPEGGTRSSSHGEDRIVYPLPQGSSGRGRGCSRRGKDPLLGGRVARRIRVDRCRSPRPSSGVTAAVCTIPAVRSGSG